MKSASGPYKGCLVFVGAFALSALVVSTLAYVLLPAPVGAPRGTAAKWAGLSAGFFLAFAVMYVLQVLDRLRDRKLLGASAGVAGLQDGARVAACGPLVADGPLAGAPFSGIRAAIYQYEIRLHRKKSDNKLCAGYFLTPCHVETPAGSVRLLGLTELSFTPVRMKGPDVLARARVYLSSTAVAPMSVAAVKAYIGAFKDDDGAVKTDTGVVPEPLDDPGLSFFERAVGDREPVCAFGRYSAERGGLVPDPSNVDPYPVRLWRGDVSAVRRSLLSSAGGELGGAVFMLALAAGAVLVVALKFGQL